METALYFSCVYAIAGLVLGALTYRSLRRIFLDQTGEDARHLIWGIVLCASLGVTGLAAKQTIISNFFYWIIFEAASFGLYFLFIWRLKFEWVRVLARRLVANT